jgi:glycosyltransferase involved in cell wall biosynthesis
MAKGDDARLRVLTLIRDLGPGYGGAEVLAVEIARRLDRQRFQSYVCTTRAPVPELAPMRKKTVERLRDAGVSVLELGRRSSVDPLPWRRLYRLLRRERIDILHSHLFRANVPGALIGRMGGVPVVVAHDHTWSYRGRRFRRFVDRELVARFSDAFFTVSAADRELLIERERIPPEKVRVVPNGLAAAPEPTGRDLRAELGLAASAPLVGALGRLEPQKAFDVLIEASARLKSLFPGVKVVIAGEGRERRRLQDLVDERGLDDTVALVGYRTDAADLLAAFDVAVMCSSYEGSPLALMEYMAAGKPIVATAARGVPELVENEAHALLVRPGRPGELADAIGRLLSDPALGASLGERARERQRSEFGIDSMVRRIESLYLELCGS